MSKTPIKKASKRKNLSKEEIQSQIDSVAKIAHIKDVVRGLFPELHKVDTIYDAQTVVNALAGFILAHIEAKIQEIKLSDITIDLSKEEDSKIKTAILAIIELNKDEKAKDLSQTLERLGDSFAKFGADKFLKQTMDNISITDMIKE